MTGFHGTGRCAHQTASHDKSIPGDGLQDIRRRVACRDAGSYRARRMDGPVRRARSPAKCQAASPGAFSCEAQQRLRELDTRILAAFLCQTVRRAMKNQVPWIIQASIITTDVRKTDRSPGWMISNAVESFNRRRYNKSVVFTSDPLFQEVPNRFHTPRGKSIR